MEKYVKDAVRVIARLSDGTKIERYAPLGFGEAMQIANTIFDARGNDVESIKIEQMFVKENGEIFVNPIDKR